MYLQDNDNKSALKEYEIKRKTDGTIQPGDELYISVTTSDEDPTNFTRTDVVSLEVTLRSYTVEDDGYIRFPYLGKVYVQDKELDDIAEDIEKALSDYIYSPSVFVKFVNKKITVLGEVGAPGVYVFYDKNINVLQAIAYAGDIGTFGNRKRVVLIREQDGKIFKHRLDLTDDNILTSPLYFLKTDDIIYVEPLRISSWGFETFPYTLILTLANSTLLIYTFMLNLY